jgi:N-acetylmuramoyl-L-alanine amidase
VRHCFARVRFARVRLASVPGMLLASWVMLPSLPMDVALAASCSSKAPADIVIALDVGHIAGRPGEQCRRFETCPWGETSARGVPEHQFNVRLAQRIRDKLDSAGFHSTHLMVISTEGVDGLQERTTRANSMHADMFLSIHHDGARDEYLKPWQFEGKALFYFDEPTGFSLHVSPRFPESLDLARTLSDQLAARGLRFTTFHAPDSPAGAQVPFLDASRGIYRRDHLFVLNRTDMPALLFEAGFIINRDEELILSSPGHQDKIASAMTDAVRKFCSAVPP